MHLERSQVRAQVHPLRLTLLLINICDPEERCGALAKCLTNARHKEMWNERGVEAAGSKDDQLCACERLEGRLRCGGARWKQLDTCDTARSRQARLSVNDRSLSSVSTQLKTDLGCRHNATAHVQDAMDTVDSPLKASTLLCNRASDEEIADRVPPCCSPLGREAVLEQGTGRGLCICESDQAVAEVADRRNAKAVAQDAR
jgi:hypothetical protein